MAYEKTIAPASAANEVEIQRNGGLFVDRTIGVSVSLAKVSLDLGKLMRFEMVETTGYRDEILRIAQSRFVYDRRFNLTPDCDEASREQVLRQWVADLGPTIVALWRGKVAGFLNLREQSPEAVEVWLAAVEVNGTALGLYAKAVEIARARGYKRLVGRISSQNMAVMNVYAMFGAQFSEPQDIFLKEVK